MLQSKTGKDKADVESSLRGLPVWPPQGICFPNGSSLACSVQPQWPGLGGPCARGGRHAGTELRPPEGPVDCISEMALVPEG